MNAMESRPSSRLRPATWVTSLPMAVRARIRRDSRWSRSGSDGRSRPWPFAHTPPRRRNTRPHRDVPAGTGQAQNRPLAADGAGDGGALGNDRSRRWSYRYPERSAPPGGPRRPAAHHSCPRAPGASGPGRRRRPGQPPRRHGTRGIMGWPMASIRLLHMGNRLVLELGQLLLGSHQHIVVADLGLALVAQGVIRRRGRPGWPPRSPGSRCRWRRSSAPRRGRTSRSEAAPAQADGSGLRRWWNRTGGPCRSGRTRRGGWECRRKPPTRMVPVRS